MKYSYKKIILFYSILISFVYLTPELFDNSKVRTQIHGEWIDDETNKKITFDDNMKFAAFNYNLDGINYGVFSGNYEIDFSKIPASINLFKIDNFDYTLYGIIKISNDSTMTLSQFSRKWKFRPISFTENKIFNFKKTKAKLNE